jgi:hypothetical protein
MVGYAEVIDSKDQESAKFRLRVITHNRRVYAGIAEGSTAPLFAQMRFSHCKTA